MKRGIGVLVLLAALGGCGGGSGDERVTLQLFGDPEELKAYRELTRAYERESGRQVSLVEVPDRDTHLQKLSTAFAGGSPPDLFLINYRNYGPYAESGVIDPAGPRLGRSKVLRRADFYPQALEAFTRGRELQCVPQNASSLVVYYNRDLLRAAGVGDPAPDWTYEDLVATARRVDGSSRVDPLGVDPNMIRAAPFVWAAGGEIVDDTERPARFTLDTPEARRGLQALLALAPFGPAELPARGKPLDERFLDGELAMFMSSRREVPTFRTITRFDWDVAAFPRLPRQTGVLHSDAFCIADGGDTNAAWRFIEFASGPVGSRLLARSGRTVPARREVARSDDFLDKRRPPRSSRVFLQAIPRVRRLPSTRSWVQLEEGADIAVEEAFYKRLGVDGLLKRLAKETDGKF